MAVAAERGVIARFFHRCDQRGGVGAADNLRLLLRDAGLFDIVALFERFFNAFDAVAAGKAFQRQRDSMRHSVLLLCRR